MLDTASRPAARSALVIGGGIAGMSAALSLSEAGVNVRLIDIDPDWKVYGAGITITGPTLRVMDRLGILPAVLDEGYAADGLLACDPSGTVIAEIETAHDSNGGIPGAGGIMRPVLHRLLAARIARAGIEVLLGLTVIDLDDSSPRAVRFSDGSTGRYDLIVGADGIFSQTRQRLFPGLPPPRYVGQICWRLMTERHPAITRRTYYLGGPMKVGMNPVARDRMYMFLLEPRAEIIRYRDTELHERLAELMSSYGGVVGELREALTAQSNIVVRPLETIFCPQPWHKDGVVLIGDAAHATTPQLASGAGMAMEDGVVLGECIAQADSVDGALDTFMKRRFERCALVVEKSLALGRLEKSGSAPVDQIRVVEAALQQLNKPY
jgi:2-polyprenyl-6-methoxyphenol hydroxylase-like FAD-dependent oxidoreductase